LERQKAVKNLARKTSLESLSHLMEKDCWKMPHRKNFFSLIGKQNFPGIPWSFDVEKRSLENVL